MRVLIFISSIDKKDGGPSRSVPILAKGLSDIGCDVTLMTLKTDDMNTHLLDGTDVKLEILPSSVKTSVLEKTILDGKFDIIHLQNLWLPSYHRVASIARKHGIKYLMTPRGTLEPWCLKQKALKKKIARWLYQDNDLNKCACIYATAEIEAQHIRELGFSNNICIIPNGIETDDYPCRSTDVEVKKQILFISRIHPKKGIEILIEAFAIIKDQFLDWNVVIAGNGENDYIQALQDKINRMNLSNRISIIGPVFGASKTRLYQESSLFCLPSFSENFGMVVAEAMSCGVPAITTNGTPWQLINGTCSTMGASLDMLGKNNRTGWCIDLSIENLAATLKEAMSLPFNELLEMGQKSSLLVNENFNYKSVALKNKALYEWIILDKMNEEKKPSFVD